MIRVEMTDRNQCEVFEAAASLSKPEERAASCVHENPAPSINPHQVAGGGDGAIRPDAWAVGAEYLQRDAGGLTGLCRGRRTGPASKQHEDHDVSCVSHPRQSS